MDETNILTDFDSLTFSHSLQILKASLPYIHNRHQKNLTIFIKALELHNALSLIQEDNNQLTACCEDSDDDTIINVLNHIRGFCTEKEQEFIDLFLNFSQAFQLFSSYRSTTSDQQQTGNSMMELLKNMLSEEQQSAFEMYSQMFAEQST